jgi:hypothetical protein
MLTVSDVGNYGHGTLQAVFGIKEGDRANLGDNLLAILSGRSFRMGPISLLLATQLLFEVLPVSA